MSKSGHACFAFAMAATVLSSNANAGGVATAAGIIVGASGPDWLEIVHWSPYGQRESVVPHRTLTHYWPLWFFVAIVSAASLPWPASLVVFGFAASCLLHILVDCFSPMGCPLISPWKQLRSPVILYRTGEASEIPFILGALAIVALDVLSSGPHMLTALLHIRRFV